MKARAIEMFYKNISASYLDGLQLQENLKREGIMDVANILVKMKIYVYCAF